MSTSHLIKDDGEYLYLYRYLHDDPDELPDWAINESYSDMSDKKETFYNYPEETIYADDGAFYEIRVEYRIRKADNKVFYDSFAGISLGA